MRFQAVAVVTGVLWGVSGCGRPAPTLPAPAGRASAARPTSSPSAAKQPVAKLPVAKPPVAKQPVAKQPVAKPAVPRSAARRVRVDSVRLEAALLRERSHAPLGYVLYRRSGNGLIADRAAAAVLQESRRLRLSPSLVAAVLLVENTPMDSSALSDAGAIGLMQVMPVHEGGLGCPSAELLEVEANICHGARVLHMYIHRNRTLPAALRRYNGCIGPLVTRRCLHYPARVMRTASSIRREMLALPADAAPPPPPAPDPPPLPPPYLRRVASAADSQPGPVIE
jgi:soluble lytic murein transglycosylase-like protein